MRRMRMVLLAFCRCAFMVRSRSTESSLSELFFFKSSSAISAYRSFWLDRRAIVLWHCLSSASVRALESGVPAEWRLEAIEDVIVLHIDKVNNHCYTSKLPEKLQTLDEFDRWAADLKHTSNVVVEYHVAGWEESLAVSRLTEVPFLASKASSCPICQGAGPRLRMPKFGKVFAPFVIDKISDPLGRVTATEILQAVLAPIDSSKSLGASFPDGPVPIIDCALSEIDHDGADEGMPPEETDPFAPRCAGDPPTSGPNLSGLQAEAVRLREQLRILEEQNASNPRSHETKPEIETLRIRNCKREPCM